jgi:Flp pilus assembly protein TadD
MISATTLALSTEQTQRLSHLMSQAFRSFDAGRFNDTEYFCKLSLADAPQHADALNLLGGVAGCYQQDERAVDWLDRATRVDTRTASYQYNKGIALLKLGQRSRSVVALGRSLELDPFAADAWFDVGIALLPDNRDKAYLCFGRSALVRPDFAPPHQQLGKLLQAAERIPFAERRFARALICEPGDPNCHNDMGKFHFDQKSFHAALSYFKKAAALRPDHPGSISNLGLNFQSLRLFGLALTWHERATFLQPDDARFHANLGECLKIAGRLPDAARSLRKAVALAPRDTEIQYMLAQGHRVEPGDPQLAQLESLLAELPQMDNAARLSLHFALAKAYEDIGEQDLAFDQLLLGNAAKRAVVVYDEAATRTKLSRIKQIFTADFIRTRQSFGHPASQPIFILGMPRSGSSLVEQILASHRQVYGAGELADLPNLLAEFGETQESVYPDLAELLTQRQFGELGRRYAEGLAMRAPTARFITDKAPGNFWQAGLIGLILPNAKIIHTRRNAVDTCLSCFSKLFNDVAFTYDLAELGRYWRLYDELMQHWAEVLPVGSIFSIDYEQLVEDLPGQTRRLLEFCGLPWDDACIAFHTTERPVNTASALQVRQPLYHNSVRRWQPSADKLAPLLRGLAGEDAL